MALPENRIKKIKLPNNTEYTIVPEQLQSNGHSLSVPSLSADDTIVTTDTQQNIGGVKNFTSSLHVNQDVRTENGIMSFLTYDGSDNDEHISAMHLETLYDEDTNCIGTAVIAVGHFSANGDNDDADGNKPDNETIFSDLDTDYFNTGITLRGDETYKLSFPAKSGVFATTEDITNVEIVDLTDLDHASYKLSVVEYDGTTYLKLNFSQGYVLDFVEIEDAPEGVPVAMFSVDMDYQSGSYDINEVINCDVYGYQMTNKTTGGLANYIEIEVNSGAIQELVLENLQVKEMNFLKVEGTFDFEY